MVYSKLHFSLIIELRLLAITILIGFVSCEEEDNKPNETETPSGNNSIYGIWARNDGQASTYLKIEGSAAITCNNGKATNGSFNA